LTTIARLASFRRIERIEPGQSPYWIHAQSAHSIAGPGSISPFAAYLGPIPVPRQEAAHTALRKYFLNRFSGLFMPCPAKPAVILLPQKDAAASRIAKLPLIILFGRSKISIG
jgi:hypothetical protein